MKKKIANIGITAGLIIAEEDRFPNYWKSAVGEDYVISVAQAGAVPMILPVIDDEDMIKQQILNLDAIIFSGGDDVDPLNYNEEHLEKVGIPNQKRDVYELRVAKIAHELKIPTLCVCRGHQLVAVHNGATLYQDLSYDENIVLKHDQYSNASSVSHKIAISKNSLLFDILKKEEIFINSFHHQIIKDMPDGFDITAKSTDGAIEAIEFTSKGYFFLSLQWHPEMMASAKNEDMQKIFSRLNEEAIKYNKIKKEN